MVDPCSHPTHPCEGCYAFPYGWTIAEIKSQPSYLRITFNEGVTVYVHEARGFANYYFRQDPVPGMPESETAMRRAQEFLDRHPDGHLLPEEEAKGRTVVQVPLNS